MKSIILMFVYLGSFTLIYLMLSLIGALFYPYKEVINNSDWFIVYTLFFGWWLAMFPAREYYVKNEEYFERVF